MNDLLPILIATLSLYGLVELFLMATIANKERRPFVIIHIATGGAFCLWVLLDGIVNWPILLALVFMTADRLQTRLRKG